jgi:hypothetical protein
MHVDSHTFKSGNRGGKKTFVRPRHRWECTEILEFILNRIWRWTGFICSGKVPSSFLSCLFTDSQY